MSYQPMLLGAARVQFQDTKLGVDVTRDITVLAPITTGALTVDWDSAEDAGLVPQDLAAEPLAPATFGMLPAAAAKPKSYEVWGRDFARWLTQTQVLEVLRHPETGILSRPGEPERDFRIRAHDAALQKRDQIVQKLRQKYGQKVAVLQERLRRAQAAVERERLQAKQQQIQTAVSVGATILDAFMGRRAVRSGTIGRATTAARGASRSRKEAQDVQRAEETVQVLQQQLADLEAQIRVEIDAALGAVDPAAARLEPVTVRPKRTGITVQTIGLAWTPR